MSIGKNIRLTRIFREDKRTVIIPLDHGISIGPIKGIDYIYQTIQKLKSAGADAVVVHKGIVKNYPDLFKGLGLIIHLSASTNLSPKKNLKELVCSVEEALSLGADAVSCHINIGDIDDYKMLSDLGKIGFECDKLGVPLLCMIYARGEHIKDEKNPDLIEHIARIAWELGSDIIKIHYPKNGEKFEQICKQSPVPIVIAGGSKLQEEEFLKIVQDAIEKGAKGVSCGRNVFQSENIIEITKKVINIVHKD